MTTTDDGARARAGGTRKSATIYDIAKVADVSHQSVSRYMRGLDMRASTKAKIEKALETHPYRPNLAARALTSGRSNRIGALTHEVDQVGPSLIIQGATNAARQAGYLLDVVTLDMGEVSELEEALDLLTQHDLAGILAFASTDSTKAIFDQTDFGVPVVVAAESETADPPPISDADHGIEELVAHLVSLGHESFAHIAGPPTWSAARNRLHAFETALERHEQRAGTIMHGDWSARSGFDAVMAIPLESLPTAIVAANDQMALGAMHALVARGLSIPGDVSVTGVDDMPEAAYFTPALTTVRLDFRNQGRAAFAALLERIDGNPDSTPTDRPEATVVIRESTGPRRA